MKAFATWGVIVSHHSAVREGRSAVPRCTLKARTVCSVQGPLPVVSASQRDALVTGRWLQASCPAGRGLGAPQAET